MLSAEYCPKVYLKAVVPPTVVCLLFDPEEMSYPVPSDALNMEVIT